VKLREDEHKKMAQSRKPGPQCNHRETADIKDGTLCRAVSPKPGSLNYPASPGLVLGHKAKSFYGTALRAFGHVGDWIKSEHILNFLKRRALIKAQDDARKDPRYKKSEAGTHCNQATLQIVKVLRAPVGPFLNEDGIARDANDQAEYLRSSSDYRVVQPDEAQKLANEGVLVIVAWKSPDLTRHGHVATVRPNDISTDPKPDGTRPNRGPLINNIGPDRRIEGENYSFSGDKVVEYYTPK
jgi:hypothetical protein